MTIIISDEIIQASQLTPKEFCQEIALYLFETGHLTVGYASQLADMPTDVFRQLLKQRHIPLYRKWEPEDPHHKETLVSG